MQPLASFDTWQLDRARGVARLGERRCGSTPCCSSSAGLGYLGWIPLPGKLDVLAHPYVLAASGFMFVDRVLRRQDPAASIRCGIRPDRSSAFPRALRSRRACSAMRRRRAMLAAAILGGTLAAGSHLAKAGSRMAINTSPEPFSNWAASFGEDLAVGVGAVARVGASDRRAGRARVLIVLVIWLIRKLWRFIGRLVERLRSTFGAAARHSDLPRLPR